MATSFSSSHHPMANTCNIIQESFFTFLRNYRYFVSTSTLLAFPYAASYLLAQCLAPSSHLFPFVHNRMRFLFLAARFPLSSPHFTFLCFKLSKTVLALALVSPFTFSFLLLARASVIAKALDRQNPNLFRPLLVTQICTTIVMLVGNAICFFAFGFFFILLEIFGLSSPQALVLFLSATGGIAYSFLIQNPQIVCNLALVSSGMEGFGGFISIAITWAVIRGCMTTALSLSVATNVALYTVEALFHYRVVEAAAHNSVAVVVSEGVLIALLYAAILVLDTLVGCVFWIECKKEAHIDHEDSICIV